MALPLANLGEYALSVSRFDMVVDGQSCDVIVVIQPQDQPIALRQGPFLLLRVALGAPVVKLDKFQVKEWPDRDGFNDRCNGLVLVPSGVVVACNLRGFGHGRRDEVFEAREMVFVWDGGLWRASFVGVGVVVTVLVLVSLVGLRSDGRFHVSVRKRCGLGLDEGHELAI